MHLHTTILFFVSMAVTLSAEAKSPDELLNQLSPVERDWVNRSCPRSLGPSLWSSCIAREGAAVSRGKPDLSELKPDLQAWVERSCPDSLGPSLAINCLNRENAAILRGYPNISFLTEEQKQWVSSSCPQSLGPSLFVSCVRRESAALRNTQSLTQPVLPPVTAAEPRQRNSSSSARSAPDTYEIEMAHDDEIFIINGEKFEAQTYCIGWEEGDQVVFLEGNPLGVCTSAELLNLRTRQKCDLWCE